MRGEQLDLFRGVVRAEKVQPRVPGNYWSVCIFCQRQMDRSDKRCIVCVDCYGTPSKQQHTNQETHHHGNQVP